MAMTRRDSDPSTEKSHSLDIHTTRGKIEDLKARLDEAVHAGSARAVEKQHAKGKKTARELPHGNGRSRERRTIRLDGSASAYQ